MSPQRKIRVLLIEDSETIRLLYKRTLEMKGFDVIEADTGQDGLFYARKKMPDVILLDMILPDMYGLEILKSIRTDVDIKHIPVLVLTTLRDITDVQKAINLGANYYSVKGNDPPQKIIDMIYKLLSRSHSPSESETEPTKPEVKDEPDDSQDIGEDDIEFIRD